MDKEDTGIACLCRDWSLCLLVLEIGQEDVCSGTHKALW